MRALLAGAAIAAATALSGCADLDGPHTVELACSKEWTLRWGSGDNPYRAVIDSDVNDRPLDRYLECVKLDGRSGWTRSTTPPDGWDVQFELPSGDRSNGGRIDGSAVVRLAVVGSGSDAPRSAAFPERSARSRLIAEVVEH